MKKLKAKKKNAFAQGMARLRAASMTPARRIEIAKKAAATRWEDHEKD